MAFTAFPRKTWRQVWSNNPQERLKEKARSWPRRTTSGLRPTATWLSTCSPRPASTRSSQKPGHRPAHRTQCVVHNEITEWPSIHHSRGRDPAGGRSVRTG
ncbi:transposase [Streptomyces sp. NBC_00117]|uniref:transposase n=1 Tax=Streptomyces sp. NBC_00117 TaxID=2975657 RepID=UPI0032465AAA